jgi:hypothetical protein
VHVDPRFDGLLDTVKLSAGGGAAGAGGKGGSGSTVGADGRAGAAGPDGSIDVVREDVSTGFGDRLDAVR